MCQSIILLVAFGILSKGSVLDSSSQDSSSDDNTPSPTCSSSDYGTTICDDVNHMWDCPDTPLSERNQIGRAIYQTSEKVLQAAQLINLGITYNIGYTYNNDMPVLPPRYWDSDTWCEFWFDFHGGCNMRVHTDSVGNVGTQFDGLLHIFQYDAEANTVNGTVIRNFFNGIWFNNFRGSDIFTLQDGSTDKYDANYLGIENLPPFFTRAFLVDVANYKGVDVLGENYLITSNDFKETLEWEGLSVDMLEKGDVVLIRTGWGNVWFDENANYWDLTVPGLDFQTALDYLWDSGVMIIGSDNWPVDPWYAPNFPDDWGRLHRKYIVCGGGFLQETLYLDEWANDALLGKVPYIGAYSYNPVANEGSPASTGVPVIIV
jgi:kynurenine formamidase